MGGPGGLGPDGPSEPGASALGGVPGSPAAASAPAPWGDAEPAPTRGCSLVFSLGTRVSAQEGRSPSLHRVSVIRTVLGDASLCGTMLSAVTSSHQGTGHAVPRPAFIWGIWDPEKAL